MNRHVVIIGAIAFAGAIALLVWHGDLILGQTPDEMETGLVPVILE